MKYLQLLFLSIFLVLNSLNASIIHTDLMPDSVVQMTIDPTFGTGSGSNLSSLDINNDGTIDFDFRFNVSPGFGWFLHIVEKNGNQIIRSVNNSTTISTPYAVVLNSNDFIGSSSNWSSAVEPLIGDTTDYNFGGQGDKFIGIKLLIGGNEHFGWIKVSFDNTASPKELLIKEYVYEDVADVPIAAGQISGPPPIPEIALSQDDTLYNIIDTLNFGTVPTANTTNRIFKIKNTGTTNLVVSHFLISTGNTADFSIVVPSDTVIVPNDSVNFTVSFTPNVTGPRASKLTFDTNDGDESTFSITLEGNGGAGGGGGASGSILIKQSGNIIDSGTDSYDFGQVTVGTSSTDTFYICNTDAINSVDIDIIDVGGFGGGGAFSSNLNGPLIINAGDSVQWLLTFTPSFNGVTNSQAFVANFIGGINYNFELLGEGIGGTSAPGLVLTENGIIITNNSTYDYGNVPLGSSLTKEFVLKTSGLTSSVTIDFLDIFNITGGSEFSTSITAPITIGASDSVIIPISYTPSALSSQNADFVIFPDFSSGVTEIQVSLTGTGIDAILIQSLDVYGQGNATEINTPSGTLQMLVDILPVTATNQNVVWSVNNSSIATISSSGILQAVADGIVIVTATSTDGSGMSDEVEIEVKNQTTSIAILTEQSFNVYPNPSSGYIVVDNLDLYEYVIISSQGKKVETTYLNNRINIESLPNGLYYLRIKEDNQIKVSKFTKK